MSESYEVRETAVNGYLLLLIGAGNRGTERVVPPWGEEYAFERQRWARRITVRISPTGRSVRVWVDGVEVKT